MLVLYASTLIMLRVHGVPLSLRMTCSEAIRGSGMVVRTSGKVPLEKTLELYQHRDFEVNLISFSPLT